MGAGKRAPYSVYEEMFDVAETGIRPEGRPSGLTQDRFLFSTKGKDPKLARLARTRAMTVNTHRSWDKLRDLFETEYRALEEFWPELAGSEEEAEET